MLKREASTAEHCLAAAALSAIAALLVLCVPPPAAKVSPPVPVPLQSDSTVVSRADTLTAIDFGAAFEASGLTVPHESDTAAQALPQVQNVSVESLRFPSFTVKDNVVRIALRQHQGRLVAYSAGSVTLRHNRAPQHPQSYRGRLLFEAKPGLGSVVVTTGKNVFSIALPCTLLSDNMYNFVELGDTAYRGTIILTAGKKGTFGVLNLLGVEEYLRGVVPLEMGRLSGDEIEALKAQAVAARTYTYRRMAERSTEAFDLLPTTADQVYGGASVENRDSDLAVATTAGLIMVFGDSIIMAYYHSTCGGVTADVFEAWGKPARTYLRSIVDADPSGNAWCRSSAYFLWEETWSWKQFSTMVTASLRTAFPERQLRGEVTGFSVDERFSCGRVKRATINGNGWTQEVGGDQIRFILRRGVGGKPILRSSSFSVFSSDRNILILRGKGYGHGVGMCQMGAIGRAQAGQNFATILKSYYAGVSIVTAAVGKRIYGG